MLRRCKMVRSRIRLRSEPTYLVVNEPTSDAAFSIDVSADMTHFSTCVA